MIGVDVGGSFTDLVAVLGGQIHTVKVSTDVNRPQDGVLEGVRRINAEDAQILNHASTHGLNAVITRRLPRIGFVTTFGHRDMLDAGRVWRPVEALTDAKWRRSFGDANRPLVPRYLRRGVRERLTADGNVRIALDTELARAEVRSLRRAGVEGLAICLLHSYANGENEVRLREIVREEFGPDFPVSISSEVSPLAKEYARASTTVIDVFMKLIYTTYTEELNEGLAAAGFRGDLNFADGGAHLVPVKSAMKQPFRIVFSGPAAGTMSSRHFGRMIAAHNLLCADIGGTSCDISLVTDSEPFVDTTIELEHDLVVNTLSNEISAIGAGGGSLITVNAAGELLVGPGSAGADPGPACYGIGGDQPTTTDTCLLMGILDPDGFAGGEMKLQTALARKAFERLDTNLTLDQRISFAFHIGINNIAEGLTNVAVSHGIDPRDYSLVAYGAAGPMLLPATLEYVQVKEVIIPPHPGLFSALGLVSTDLVYASSRSAYIPLGPDSLERVMEIYREMETELLADIPDGQRAQASLERSFDGRLVGQSWETPFVPVPCGEIDSEALATMVESFHQTYQLRSGNRFDFLPVEAVTFRVQAKVPTPKVEYAELDVRSAAEQPAAIGTTQIKYLRDEPVQANVYRRTDLLAGDQITGPAIIREDLSTTFLVPNQHAVVGRYGELHITMAAPAEQEA